MNKIQLASALVINLFFYMLSKITPKSKNLWVFSAWFGQKYSDNPRAFFEFVNKHHGGRTKAVWITKNPNVLKELQQKGYCAYHERSCKGIWYQLRASKAFICQSLHDDLFSPCVGQRTEVVQLWHGIPLKKIMFDVFGGREKQKNSMGRFIDWLSPYNKHRNDIVIATSELTQNILAKAFRVPLDKVLTCGFPRNDVFFENIEHIENEQFKCIYMPTFRGGMASECDLFEKNGFDIEQMEAELAKHNIQLTLRMHPVNKPPYQIVKQIKNSKNIQLDVGNDIYQTINQYDCLITDYSSIYFDFLLSNKPIVFAPFDLDLYKKRERALYFEFEEVTLKPYCYSWNDILNRLIMLKNNSKSIEYKKHYDHLKAKFHDKTQHDSSPFSNQLYNELTK
jgi:CDP-glycerol glycerophosphotransferase (TagB/SpsB family)